MKLMIQKYYYAFDSPNDSKLRHKSLQLLLNFRTLGWNITPIQQLTASQKNSNCWLVDRANRKYEDRTGYVKLLRKVDKNPSLTSKKFFHFHLHTQQDA